MRCEREIAWTFPGALLDPVLPLTPINLAAGVQW